MEFQNKVVLLTGSYMGIGKTIKEEFIKQGAIVCDIDIQDGDTIQAILANKKF